MQPQPFETPQETFLTADEVAQFRQWAASQRQQNNGIKEFDLATPPRQFSDPYAGPGPYRYQEFPFTMYNHRTRQAKNARNFQEREAMRSQGWSEDPITEHPQERQDAMMQNLSGADVAQASKFDLLLKMPPEKLDRLLAIAERLEAEPAAPEPETETIPENKPPIRRTK